MIIIFYSLNYLGSMTSEHRTTLRKNKWTNCRPYNCTDIFNISSFSFTYFGSKLSDSHQSNSTTRFSPNKLVNNWLFNNWLFYQSEKTVNKNGLQMALHHQIITRHIPISGVNINHVILLFIYTYVHFTIL